MFTTTRTATVATADKDACTLQFDCGCSVTIDYRSFGVDIQRMCPAHYDACLVLSENNQDAAESAAHCLGKL